MGHNVHLPLGSNSNLTINLCLLQACPLVRAHFDKIDYFVALFL